MKPLLLYLLIPFVFVLLHFNNLRFPGLHYDELMWIGPTLAVPNSPFTFDSLFGQPFMLMEYIGALKVYFYRVVFFFFQPSYESVRLPMLLVAGFGVAVISHAVELVMGRSASVWLAILLTLSPATWLQAQIDLGPSTFEFFFRAASILLIVSYFQKPNRATVVLLFFVFSLGLWNKASYIWHINATVAGLFTIFLVFPRHGEGVSKLSFLGTFKKSFSIAFVFAATYLVFGLLAMRYLYHAQTLPSDSAQFLKFQNFLGVLAGTALFDFGWNKVPPAFSMLVGILLLVPVILSVGLSLLSVRALCRRRSSIGKELYFELAASSYTIVMLVQIFLVKDANKPWHAFTVLPVVFINLLYGVFRVFESPKFTRLLGRPSTALLCFSLLLSLIHAYIFIEMRHVQKGTKSWDRILNTTALDPLYHFLGEIQGNVVFLDWGFFNSAIFFNYKNTHKFSDFTHEAVNGRLEAAMQNSFKEVYFVTHGEQTSAFPQGRVNLFAYARKVGINLCKLRNFVDFDETVVAEVWYKCSSRNEE